MNYRETLDYIYGANRFGTRNGFQNAKELLRRMGDPQNSFKSIHIAGTNGKGSITSMLTHILLSNGYKVGMFISPHLEEFTERIQVNLVQISREDVVRIVSIIRGHIEDMVADGHDHPRWFEIITAIGFQYFAECGVDYAVVEAGLGGRMDSTNILTPQLSIITSISHDHISILGDNIEGIAFEKAGIIKPKTPVVMYPQRDEVSKVIRQVAYEQNAPIYEVSSAQIETLCSNFGEQIFNFEYEDFRLEELTIHLSGKHQILNAATVVMSILALNDIGVNIPNQAIISGLASAKWPGRLERLGTNPDIIVDGAHNVASAKILATAIGDYYADRNLILVIGMLEDKEVDRILQILCPLAETVIVTHPDSDRAIPMDVLFQKARPYCKEIMTIANIEETIARATDLAGPSGVVVFSGSLYLVGEVRKLIKYESLS